MQIGTGTGELTYSTGTFAEESFGHEYTTKAVVGVDAENKIRYVTVTGECSDAETWGENSKWYNGKDAFLKGLYGKTLADLQTIAGTGEKAAASGYVPAMVEYAGIEPAQENRKFPCLPLT